MVAVSLLSQRGLPQYAGIIMTFPIITIISLLCIPENQAVAIARAGVVGLLYAAIFIIGYIAFSSFGIGRIGSIAMSTLLWAGIAVLFSAVILK